MLSSPTSLCSSQRLARTPHGRERGTASVEAVIILPILAILLGGILWINRTSTAAIEARETARSCAWRYSQNNCEIIPDGCEDLVGPAPSREVDHGDVTQAVENGFNKTVDGGDYQQVLSSIAGTLLAPAINEAFGDAIQATVKRSVPGAGAAKGKTEISVHYRLACNLKPRDPMNVAATTWEMFNP